MSTETVKALTGLVDALTHLVRVAGTGPTAITVMVVVALVVGVPWIREHQRNKRVDIVIEHKEREVLRLAEDNRRYREVYLARLGVPGSLLADDAKDSKAVKDDAEKRARDG